MIDISDIRAAATRLDGVAIRTPLIEHGALSDVCGGRVFVKPETMQRTGSFKIRGAYNRLSQLSAEDARNGAVAWSSGNHAQGVAAAGALLGIRTTIVMPEDAPKSKLANTRALGGAVVTYDRYTGDREAIAREIAAKRGAVLVPSYDHKDIIAGQGTVGLEIAEDLIRLGISSAQVLIPCGGGGLLSGSAIALQTLLSDCNVVPVEPVDFDDTARSLRAGERCSIAADARSICDALQSPMPGALTFPILKERVREVATVSDIEVREAMRFAFRHLKLVVEPGGAAALAALLSGRLATVDGVTVVVLSGGNVDTEFFADVQTELG